MFEMRVLQVIPRISTESAGPSYSVPALCRGLKNSGCDVSLHLLDAIPGGTLNFAAYSYPSRRFPHWSFGRSPEMYKGLKVLCKSADIVHNNSVWMMPNIYPAWAKRGTACKLITQPRGTFSKWAMSRSRLKKVISGIIGQYAALRATDMWIATSSEEFEDIRRLGYRQPVAIIPNGVDLPNYEEMCNNGGDDCERNPRRRMFFLSRIHPTKNVETLIRAWGRLENEFEDWDLSIVGPDKNNSYADEMKALCVELGCKRISFEGEIKGADKYRFMASADCEVLPTHSENFGMVVAEALACGTPVICSKGAPWEGLVSKRCGWWVDAEESAMENAMREAMSRPYSDLKEMGRRGREWMSRDFDWDAIGRKMKAAYAWLITGGERPEYVYD